MMTKRKLNRSDVKTYFYAYMYSSTPLPDMIATIENFEEIFDIDEGAKEYLGSIMERMYNERDKAVIPNMAPTAPIQTEEAEKWYRGVLEAYEKIYAPSPQFIRGQVESLVQEEVTKILKQDIE